MVRRIMHVDLDAFFVSVEQVLNPELSGKPVVVGGRPDRRGVVAAASYEARAFGLHSGMPLITASRLCPQAIFIEGNFQRYRDASRKFMVILADFSPFLEPMGLDEAYLDATGFESIHGSARQMAEKIRKRVKDELGLAASVGISGCKIMAKVASDQAKPDGLLEVPAGTERSFISTLPIARLPGIGKKTESILKSIGIDTIGQLADTSLSILKSHFGIYGEMLYKHAKGIDESSIEPPGEAKSISRETTFGKDTRNSQLLTATLRYLSERVGSQLRQLGKQTRCVTLKLRYADFTTTTRQQTLNQPADFDQVIFETGRRLLENELAVERQAVRLVGIGVASLVESGKQLDMLDSTTRRLQTLNATIDHIRKKYGFSAIQTGGTLLLKDIFNGDAKECKLHTPSLPR